MKTQRRRGQVQATSLYRTLPLGANVLTSREIARYLHVHLSTVYRLLRKQQLPGFKIGSDWRFNMEEIDRWSRNGGADSLRAASTSVGEESSDERTAKHQKAEPGDKR
jgi:excisionase family DNA binding protein